MASKPQHSKEIVKRDVNQESIMQVPDYLRRTDGAPLAGVSKITNEDVTVARLGLANSDTTTPQMNEDDSSYIPGLKGGDFFNSVTAEIYGPKVKIIPLDFSKSRTRWPPKGAGGNRTPLCQSFDSITGNGDPGGDCLTCKFSQFGTEPGKKRPPCTFYMNYPALVVQAGKKIGMESLVLHAFKSTSIPAGKQFNSIIRIRNVDIYCGIYELSSFKKSGDEGIYFTHNAVQPAGWVSKEMLPMIQIIAASLAGKTYAASPDTEEPGATEEV